MLYCRHENPSLLTIPWAHQFIILTKPMWRISLDMTVIIQNQLKPRISAILQSLLFLQVYHALLLAH